MRSLVDYVSSQFGVAGWMLFEKTRQGSVCKARQVCMFMMREYNNNTLHDIGLFFGLEHATALHAYRVTTTRYKNEKPFRQMLDEVIEAWYNRDFTMPLDAVYDPLDEPMEEEQYIIQLT
jgi:chromosomal replication initiation ATPase DnaA